MNSDYTKENATRYVVNAEFTKAAVFFKDGSHLTFEHTSRANRWARPSTDGTTADAVCRAMTQFRLNAKHLQMFFGDGSNAEFGVANNGPEESGKEI
jgi:hypothetical protein